MQTAYVVRGHIDAEGTIVLDEPAALTPGPVILTILPVRDRELSVEIHSNQQQADLWSRVDTIAALPGPLPPEDGLTARDADVILYGAHNGTNDVR